MRLPWTEAEEAVSEHLRSQAQEHANEIAKLESRNAKYDKAVEELLYLVELIPGSNIVSGDIWDSLRIAIAAVRKFHKEEE